MAKFLNGLIEEGLIITLPMNFKKQSADWWFAREIYFLFSEDSKFYACRGIKRVVCIFCGCYYSSKIYNWKKHLVLHWKEILEIHSFTMYNHFSQAVNTPLKKLLGNKWRSSVDYDDLTDDERDDILESKDLMEQVAYSNKGRGIERAWKLTGSRAKHRVKDVQRKKRKGVPQLICKKVSDYVTPENPHLKEVFDRYMVKFKNITGIAAKMIEEEEILSQILSVCCPNIYSNLLY